MAISTTNNLKKITELHEALLKHKGDLVRLSYALYPDYFSHPSSPLHYKLSDHLIVDEDNLIVAYPRDYGKTLYATTFIMTHTTVFADRKYIVYVGASAKKAEGQLANAVTEILSHPILKYYVKKVYVNNASQFEFEHITGVRICFKAFGAGVNLRGERYLQHRPDLIIVDDIEDLEAVRSKTNRDNLREWFFADVIPMTSSGRIIVVGTILHSDSLLNSLLDNPPQSPKQFKALKYGILDEEGKPTWEEKFPLEKIEAMKADAQARDMLHIFYMERMNIAVSPEDQVFKSEYFKYIEETDFNTNVKQSCNIFIAVDLAATTEAYSDYTAISVIAVSPDNHTFVIDVIRGKWDNDERLKQIFSAFRKYRPVKIGVERGAIWKGMEQNATRMMIATNTFISFEMLDPYRDRKSKGEKIAEALHARYKTGTVWHIKSKVQALEEELLTFPRSKHDDCADATAYAVNISYPPSYYSQDYGTIQESFTSPCIF